MQFEKLQTKRKIWFICNNNPVFKDFIKESSIYNALYKKIFEKYYSKIILILNSRELLKLL